VEKPVSPMDRLRVECVGNRHDNSDSNILFDKESKVSPSITNYKTLNKL